MDITPADLYAECDKALAQWPWIWAVEIESQLPRGLLLAVGSRETNLTDEIGDNGHGHGVWQLDDRSHTIPDPFPVTEQAQIAAQMLSDNFKAAGSWQGACDMYNSGRPTDASTTGGDYGTDVMGRLWAINVHYPEPSLAYPEGMIARNTAGQGYWCVRANGAVYAFAGAPYLGPNSKFLAEWGIGNNTNPIVGIADDGAGGYVLEVDAGLTPGQPALYHIVPGNPPPYL
jgi:hypothetical protein